MTKNQIEENKGNILIVDDTPENLQVLSATLSDRGYKVRGVINGKMAIRAARSGSPDLILLDIKMPVKTGFDVLEWVRSQQQFQELQVIILSSSDEEEDVKRASQKGVTNYFVKSPQLQDVMQFLRNGFGQQ